MKNALLLLLSSNLVPKLLNLGSAELPNSDSIRVNILYYIISNILVRIRLRKFLRPTSTRRDTATQRDIDAIRELLKPTDLATRYFS